MQYLLEPEADEETAADPVADLSECQAGEDDDDDDDDGSVELEASQEDDVDSDNDGPLIIQHASKRGRDANTSGSQTPS